MVVRATVDAVLVVWTLVVLVAMLSVMSIRTMQPVRIDHQYRSAPVTVIVVPLPVMARGYERSRRVRLRYDLDVMPVARFWYDPNITIVSGADDRPAP